MAREKLFHVGVKALIVNSANEVLVLKANPARFIQADEVYWDIPGGRIKVGDSAQDTLLRELKEEISVAGASGITFFMSAIAKVEIPISKTERVGLVLMVYRVRIPENSNITLDGESTEYAWLKPEEAAKKLSIKYPPEFTDAIKRL